MLYFVSTWQKDHVCVLQINNLFDLTLRTNKLDACFMSLKLEESKYICAKPSNSAHMIKWR